MYVGTRQPSNFLDISRLSMALGHSGMFFNSKCLPEGPVRAVFSNASLLGRLLGRKVRISAK